MKKETKKKFPPHKITTTSNGITGHLEKFCEECQKRQKEFNKELLQEYKTRPRVLNEILTP